MKTSSEIEKLLINKKNLIFDFDGTIADTSHLHEAAFNEALQSLNISVDYKSIAGMSTLDAMRACLKNKGEVVNNKEIDLLAANKHLILPNIYLYQVCLQNLLRK